MISTFFVYVFILHFIVFQLYFSRQKQFLIISVLRNNNNTA